MHELQRLVGVDRRHAVRIGQRPVAHEAVVARGTLEVHAEKDLRDVLRRLHRRDHRGIHLAAPDDARGEALALSPGFTNSATNWLYGLFADQRGVKPPRDLLAAAVDEAGPA